MKTSTIGTVVLSYDINSLHTKVKKNLEDLGYLEQFKSVNNSTIYNLPNTTLWHEKKSSNQAMKDLKTICKDLKVTIEKAVAIRAFDPVGFS